MSPLRVVRFSSLAATIVVASLFCGGALAQTPPASALMVARNSGMCVEMAGGSKANGLRATQRRCMDAAYQQWTFRPVTGGYQIVNRDTGLCLDVGGASTADRAPVIQWTCGAQANQRWALRASGDWVNLVAAHSGKCLNVDDASIDDGAALIQWPCGADDNERWTLSAPAAPSRWSAKLALPIVPVAASTLRNGKILTWSAYDRLNFGGDRGRTYTALFDPATGRSSERLVSNTGHDMFCPGTTVLADGRVLVTGGSSSAKASVYNPATNNWTAAQALNVPRGYQGDTVLSSGEVLTVGGSWSGGEGGKIGEVWKANTGWRRLPNVVGEALSGPDPAGIYRADNHMWLFGAANGYAFHAGPSAAMHWISTTGQGAVTRAGNRADDPYAQNGNVVMYEAGKLLKLGGAPAYENVRASPSAYAIDFSRGPAAAVTVVKQKPMAFPRAFANAVALPNGQVVVIGGMNYPVPFSDARSVMIPEVWTPATGAFTRLAPMATPRNYHSVATLMLDGRVFAGGGGLCGGCTTNHPDAEILTPPYLLNADGSPAARPAITASPATTTWGATLAVTTDRIVTSFALVRLSAVTHSVNNDQRRLSLPIASSSGATYQLRAPSDRGTLLPGDWMLFAMDARGVPSVAKIVRVR